MTNKCFITKYPATVDNKDLLKLGEFRVNFNKTQSSTNRFVSVASNKAQTITVIGGTFTDGTTSKPVTVDDTYTRVDVSNTDCKVCIPDKYSITRFMMRSNDDQVAELDFSYFTNIYSIIVNGKSLSLNTSNLKDCKLLTHFQAPRSATVTGTLSDIAGLSNLTHIDIGGTQVTGTLSDIAGLSNLTYIDISVTQVTGTLSDIAGLSNLTNLYINGLAISGTIAQCPRKVEDFRCASASPLTGDLADLPSTIKCVFLHNSGGEGFSWTKGKKTGGYMFAGAIELNATANVDDFLNDFATYTKLDNYNSLVVHYQGSNRTSESDAAISAIQNKGFTINLNKV